MNFEALPAGELMRAGLADAAAGRETLPSLLVVSFERPSNAAGERASRPPAAARLVPRYVRKP
jgi:hypothetical protein